MDPHARFVMLPVDISILARLQPWLGAIPNRELGRQSMSLSDEKALWDAFCELRTARNKFAHQGKAMVNNKEVTAERAAHLVNQAAAIVDWIETFLPAEHRRPQVVSPTRVMSRTKAVRG